MKRINNVDISSNLEKLDLLISQLDPTVYEKLLHDFKEEGVYFSLQNDLSYTGRYIRDRISLVAKCKTYSNYNGSFEVTHFTPKSFDFEKIIKELEMFLEKFE